MHEGEKLYEIMLIKEDTSITSEYKKHFVIYPHI